MDKTKIDKESWILGFLNGWCIDPDLHLINFLEGNCDTDFAEEKYKEWLEAKEPVLPGDR